MELVCSFSQNHTLIPITTYGPEHCQEAFMSTEPRIAPEYPDCVPKPTTKLNVHLMLGTREIVQGVRYWPGMWQTLT